MNNQKQTQYAGTLYADDSQYAYQYRTMSVSHLAELQEDIDRLKRAGQISNAEILQGYLNEIKFELPEDFLEAQSILVLAIAVPLLSTHFRFQGRRYPAYMPPNYYQPAFTRPMMIDEIQHNIIKEAGYRVEETLGRYHLKLSAVRSGLGRYGRNNICYVDEMGSFLNLRAYLTDYRFGEDNWHALQMLDLCQDCLICRKNCPGGAIPDTRFTLDAGHCISLYNEVEGILPEWIPDKAHNAIFGCMKCQAPCPANREAMKQVIQVDDFTEEETGQLISGKLDDETLHSVSQKLRIPYLIDYPETVQVISRNIKALLNA